MVSWGYQSRAITASASRTIRATISRAGSSRSIGAPWPAQSERRPESPPLTAAARISRVRAFWTGKGASGSPDISRVNRFASPRAARPEKARVITVESSRASRSAARYGPLVDVVVKAVAVLGEKAQIRDVVLGDVGDRDHQQGARLIHDPRVVALEIGLLAGQIQALV